MLRIFSMTPSERRLYAAARRSGQFDANYYTGAYSHIHPFFLRFPLRHYVVFGEARGFRPNPDFSPAAYLEYNPDVAEAGMSPLGHWLSGGQGEGRIHKELPKVEAMPERRAPALRLETGRPRARFAVVIHVYYPDLWPEFEQRLTELGIDYDLFVTLTWRGEETEALAEEIQGRWPEATVLPLENKGRDILPFLTLVNAGVLEGYDAVCKIHTKKSPHRQDGDHWRRHLVSGVLPEAGLSRLLDQFVADPQAGFWVADGQFYDDTRWWGTNFETTRRLLRRIEIEIDRDHLSFPAGSIYWVKPLVLGMLRAMHLEAGQFEVERTQVDGTLAHAMERAMGFVVRAGGQRVIQTSELVEDAKTSPAQAEGEAGLARPGFVSAFYLPQFHPVPENDRWWGKGFTEWRGAVGARPMFEGHSQPMLPSDLGFYDLRVTEVMGEQAELARGAGIDAFCVYHYWFDGRRILEQPLDRLLARPEIDFPFYLCWANESWRRNWDGLSGTVLLEQSYAEGFEAALVEGSLPYMRDPRYSRPDGTRPRFVIYRPEDMPDPAGSVARMRAAWRAAGIGEVELGAVRFHIEGAHPVPEETFDFWVEMPPHGLVKEPDYLFGGPKGNLLQRETQPGFEGLVYDYARVAARSTDPAYVRSLPRSTICGAMPGWDNTARRGLKGHLAYGANPASFRRWLMDLQRKRIAGSYRQELFLNAWNEWAEKAVLEPSQAWGDLYLQVLRERIDTAEAQTAAEPLRRQAAGS
ncbi:glycoside hydrolase family 99-like domain-containing protein [Pseudoroseicyclus aestuarii]